MTVHLAHIMDFGGVPIGPTIILIGIGALLVLLLSIEHTYVKHGRLTCRLIAKPLAAVAVVSLFATLSPLTSAAQDRDRGQGLPDLISDAPFIWFNKYVTLPNGEHARVMAFDGYLHNIGTGPLDVRGNPQIPGDVQQYAFDGEQWEPVGTPRVQFETEDGHNHFHLMDAARYQMWNEARTEVISDAPKVGFCLIDTEQIEDRFESDYDISVNNYCQRDMPDTTELSMGITPGWRDTYEANITFQWIDTSNILPGRYWVSAEVDPLDQIVESNEDNNGIVFSRNKYEVDGYNARPLDVQSSETAIELKADSYGIVGQRAFVIDQGPANGALDAPIGVDWFDSSVQYTPNEGFVGTDSFVYYAHDTASPYPFEPQMIEVIVEVVESEQGRVLGASDGQLLLNSFDTDVVVDQPVEILVATTETIGATYFGAGLPPGLTISTDGLIGGLPTVPGEYEATIVAVIDDGQQARVNRTFTVTEGERQSLHGENDFWTRESRRVSLRFGTGNRDASYEGSGMPAGVEVDSAVPQMSGTPEEVGTYTIEIRELIDGQVVDAIEFTWTVTPSTRPAFTL